MGFLSAFEFKNKNGKFYLHVKERNGSKVFYFSKEPEGALNDLPSGYRVGEHPVTGMPFLKKDTESMWAMMFPPIPKAAKTSKTKK